MMKKSCLEVTINGIREKENIMIENTRNKFHKDTFDKTSEERRQKVLKTAIEEFALRGYNATSINDISRKAQVSIGAMYSYFASKEDLFLAIVNNAYFLMDDILKDVLQNSRDIFDCVRRMIYAARKFATDYPQLNRIYLDITTQALSHMSIRLSNTLEIITPQILCEFIIKAKSEGKIKKDLNERVAAYCMDNIFTMYQFSFSSDYYKERLKIYIGEESLDNIDKLEDSMYEFITGALLSC